jgi:hypothetical protein
MRPRCAIFILGAGFSRPAGLPLAPELWQEVRNRAERISGRADKFKEDLETYLRYRSDCDGLTLAVDDVDFEDFLGFLDVEFYLDLRGSDTWSEDGNETQVMVKTLIAQVLTERTPSTAAIPQLYLKFAEGLEPQDTVVTFNYDILLERALTLIGRPFRLFPRRYKSVGRGTAEVDDSGKEVKILKLHGSIDWFDKKRYRKLEEMRASHGFGSPEDPIFNNRENIQVEAIVDGPRLPDDPLREMHRVLNVETLYRDPPIFEAAPWLLNPSSMKLLFANPVRDFWGDAGRDGLANLGMAIIGYSLPSHDDYARQVLYRLVRNYQAPHWQEISGHTKPPLVLIDLRPEPEREKLKQRYRFVNWAKSQCRFDGFNEEVLPLLFPQLERHRCPDPH